MVRLLRRRKSRKNHSQINEKESKQRVVVEPKKREGKWLRHYCSSHKILLVGEGDFSFSVCLAKAFRSASNMVATSLDSLDFLKENYPNAEYNIGYLRKRGCIVLHEVDATDLHLELLGDSYDRIIFNFPLAGFFHEPRKDFLMRNRKLVRMFMEEARHLIAYNGEVHITHKTSASYREWNIEDLAKQIGLRLIEDVEFKLSHYRGYKNKYGFGGNNNFNCYPSDGRGEGLIAYDGEIHITHKTSASCRAWNINLAKQSGFSLVEEMEFKLSHYRGYSNKYGFRGNGIFNCYPSMTCKFRLK